MPLGPADFGLKGLSAHIRAVPSRTRLEPGPLRWDRFRIEREKIERRLLAASWKKRVTAELSGIDSRVRSHERTHIAILGPYAQSSADYSSIRGPEGRLYSVGGSVKVDTRPIPGNPEATLRKARLIRMAALGPMQPSAQDMRIAVESYRLEMEAKQAIAERREGGQGRLVNLLV